MELYGELAMKGSRKYPFDPFICYCPLFDNGRPSVVEAYIRSPPSPPTLKTPLRRAEFVQETSLTGASWSFAQSFTRCSSSGERKEGQTYYIQVMEVRLMMG
ncbi:uncharacterized protein MCYG_01495 [Microsporum canis CBS 113480]|uniref:Uncharacterized protein n=1 Tax=Arthroderma otae (strain ATCC MYA-4605 / CBS 113480) TaxID=554155 RepID=C5FH46_ARTOC|nr:uncharacterized protein MCYG_01495 [Microsporum canis CBS 113480]EEQ28676.1 predicted protein [Microsporum canis CBS 113480]